MILNILPSYKLRKLRLSIYFIVVDLKLEFYSTD